jgi:hypothetical protein
MSFLVRMEALATPLVGLEGSGIPTLKCALADVVIRLADKSTVACLNKALQTALNRVVEKHGDPATKATKATKPRGCPPKASKEAGSDSEPGLNPNFGSPVQPGEGGSSPVSRLNPNLCIL